jgi:hypothetical protein
MRRLLITVTVAVGSIFAAHTAAAAEPTPTLRVVDRSPLVIEGRGFAPSGMVTLITRVPGTTERKVLRSNTLGRFRVTVPGVTLTGARRCGAGVVIAAQIGRRELVLWHARGLPNCPSPLRPPSVPAVPSV